MSDSTPELFEKYANPLSSGGGLRSKSVRGALFLTASGGIEFVVRLGSTLVLARILSPEDFGLVVMVMALIDLADKVNDLGLGTATIQRKTVSHREVSSLFCINVLVGGFLTFTFVLLSHEISTFYGDGRLTMITPPLATTLLFRGMAVQHEALLNRQFKQGNLALTRLMATITSSGVGIILALIGFGYWALVVREVARNIFYLIGICLSCPWMPSVLFRLEEVRDFLKFGRDLTVTNVFITIIGKIDGIIVGRYFGSAVLGSFRQAQNLTTIPVDQFSAPIFCVAQPGLSSLQSDPRRYRRYYLRVTGLVALFTMPIGVFFATYSREITLLVLGDKWLPAVPFVGIFAVAVAVRPSIATTAIVLVTLGRSRVLLGLSLVHCLVLAILMIVGLPLGALGIATAHVATSLVLILPNLHYSFKGSPVNVGAFLAAIRMPFVATCIMGVSLVILRKALPIAHPSYSLVAGLGIAATMYLSTWIFIPSGRAELRMTIVDVKAALLGTRIGVGS